ncbi:helix-turn-helix domain-containing protein [Hufsiella ginkgonis]|uniref:Helix-turn-helix domain-containing protein n=1 Tax=Hufsiella ginkgonis TaxID=2695274 RepID=A0A7K1XZ90_9SPHI|nr:helix-turn-helix domain-containing protein [Hufsiella ginkgonis]MXV16262.1 helix-turn-helix domain-containing protein [Hufsiella ginkgonis]
MPEPVDPRFKRVAPSPELAAIIECYWIIISDDATPAEQKIIPDGFVEIIFHLGDPYVIRLKDRWEEQPTALLAGQISRHFMLKNTGRSHMVAIKLKPTAVYHLFGLDMHLLKDRVADLHQAIKGDPFRHLETVLRDTPGHREVTGLLNDCFKKLLADSDYRPGPADRAVELITGNHGMISVSKLLPGSGTGERRLEYLFRKMVGLSPKLFARIVRFNYIFSLVDEEETNWSEIVYKAAFFDQSHFIRNFKAFTGENPSAYAFREKNIANFFLQPKQGDS